MKKLVLIMLIAVLALATVLGGCSGAAAGGGSSAKTDNKQLSLSLSPDGYGDVWVDLISMFQQKYPDIEIAADIEQGCSSRLQPSIIAGNPPDLVYANSNEYDIHGGIFADQFQDVEYILNDKIEGTDKTYADLFKPSVIDACTFNNNVMLIPMSGATAVTFFDKKLLRDSGITPPKSYEEMMALGQQLADKGVALYGYNGMYPGYVLNSLIGLSVYAYGGSKAYDDSFFIASKDGWHSDAVKRALQDFKGLCDSGYLLKGSTALDHTQMQMELLNRKVAFIPSGSWFESEMSGSVPDDFEIGFMPVPTKSADSKEFIGAYLVGMGVPAKAKNPENAKKFVHFFYSEEAQQIAAAYGIEPPVKNLNVEVLSNFTPSIQEINSYIAQDQVVLVDLKYYQLYPTLLQVLSDNVNLLALGEITIDEFCNEAEDEAERLRSDPDVLKIK